MSGNQFLDMKVCHDWRGKPIIPFKYYVASSTLPASGLDNFFCFGQLPVEIQFRVLQFCSASTLFSLMHTTSTLRTEAKKLFWSQRDTWYRSDAAFFTVMGGSLGPSMFCPKFAKTVQQLDILFTSLVYEFKEAHPNAQIGAAVVPTYNLKWKRMAAANKMLTFWKTVKERFPSVKRVVLSDDCSILTSSNKDLEAPIAPEYAALIRACPRSFDLEVFICLTNWVRFQYDDTDRLYKLVEGPEVSWELVDDDFRRKVVMQGPKQFEGTVGLFQKLVYQKQLLHSRARGKRQVMMDLWIKYEFMDSPLIYVCPKRQCATPFSTLKEWKKHVLTERHDILDGISLMDTQYHLCRAPEDVMTEVMANMSALSNAWESLTAQYMAYRELWGEEGSSKRRQCELTFLAQLELDPEWEGSEPVTKCFIWTDLQEAMYTTSGNWVAKQ